MKFLLVVVLAVTTVASGMEFQEKLDINGRSVSSQVVDWLEGLKQQMPCGFPGMGLGPLSPARVSNRKLATTLGNMDLEGEIKDFILYDLDNFDIEFKINVLLSRVTFKFHWHKVHFDTFYSLLLKQNTGLGLKMSRNGGAKFALSDFILSGTAKYNIIGKLRLKEIKLLATVGDVKSEIENLSSIAIVNKKLNAIIEEWVKLAINDHSTEMQELSNELIVPIANEKIGDRTLADVIAAIGGGGGEGGAEKEECIPPTVL